MTRLALIIAACATAAACSAEQSRPAPAAEVDAPAAGKMTDGHMSGGKMDMMAPAAGDSEATRGYKASMMSMMTDMPAYVGNADVDFMKQMRVHHQAAIAMAKVELANGRDAQARTLAEEVITTQEREILMIDTWLAQKGASVAPAR